jgi:nucleoside-diphosphate-sugar epimerase
MGTVLVVGGTGFIGKHTARCLADAGEQVVVTYRRQSFTPPKIFADVWESRIRAARCDVLDLPQVMRVVRDYRVDSVVDFSHISNYEGTIYQAMQINVMGLVNVLEAAAISSVRKFTYVSSAGATAGADGPPTGIEEEVVNIASPPVGLVTPSKKVGEVLSLYYGSTFKFPVVIVRPGGVSYGPYAESQLDSTKMLRPMIEDALAGKAVNMPELKRLSPLNLHHVSDTAAGITVLHTAPTNQYRLYCVEGGPLTTWGEVANILMELIPGAVINLGDGGEPSAVQPHSQQLRISKEFAFRPRYSIRDGLKQYVEWYRGGQT